MKCSECGADFLPADDEEEICGACQLQEIGLSPLEDDTDSAYHSCGACLECGDPLYPEDAGLCDRCAWAESPDEEEEEEDEEVSCENGKALEG